MSWSDLVGAVAPEILDRARATSDSGREGEPEHEHGLAPGVADLYEKGVVDFVLVRHRQPEHGLLLDALRRNQATPEHVPVVGPLELVWLSLLHDPAKAEDFAELVQQVVGEPESPR